MISNKSDIVMKDFRNEHYGYSHYERYISFRRTEDEQNPITQAIKEFGIRSLYAENGVKKVDEADFENNGRVVDEDLANETGPTLFKDFVNSFTQLCQDSLDTSESKIRRNQDYYFSMERKRDKKPKKQKAVSSCVFCENNNEPKEVVQSHAVRDSLGRVLCPKLRSYKCPICGESGDSAHTLKYCPKKEIFTMEDLMANESPKIAMMRNREYPYRPRRF